MKRQFQSLASKPIPPLDYYEKLVYPSLESIEKTIRISVGPVRGNYPDIIATNIGGALGGFFAVVEYGLSEPKFADYNYGVFRRLVLGKIREIVGQLIKLRENGYPIAGKYPIALSFVARCIQNISRSKSAKLNDTHKNFLAEIAVMFS